MFHVKHFCVKAPRGFVMLTKGQGGIDVRHQGLLLDGGTLVIDGFHAFWNRGPAGEFRFPCYAVLVSTTTAATSSIPATTTTSMRVLPFEKPLQMKEQTIPRRARPAHLKPSDINYVSTRTTTSIIAAGTST